MVNVKWVHYAISNAKTPRKGVHQVFLCVLATLRLCVFFFAHSDEMHPWQIPKVGSCFDFSGKEAPTQPERYVDEADQHRHLDQRPDDRRQRLV
jgi:hypothetical protein